MAKKLALAREILFHSALMIFHILNWPMFFMKQGDSYFSIAYGAEDGWEKWKMFSIVASS
jgi:hypothetical protein